MFSLDYNPEWLLAYRFEALTSFFKIFPIFVNEYFCFTVIALGYWLRPQNRVFIYLGLLVPLTAISNHSLKNLFAIPRPPSAYHLIQMGPSYGFPSGDAMLATVFFGMIYLATTSRALKLLCLSIVLCVMASRVYLGVHSPYDVVGGAFFGLVIIALWNSMKKKNTKDDFFGETNIMMWLLFFIIFSSTLKDGPMPRAVVMSFGALMGWGLARSSIHQNLKLAGNKPPVPLTQIPLNKWITVGISLALLIAISKFIPMPKDSPIGVGFIGFAKYALIANLIYSALPKFQRWSEA